MKSYIIKYQGKKVFSRGEDARDAFDRYCERIQKFNSRFALPWEAKLELIDADTGGDEWATFFNHSDMFRVSVDLFKKEKEANQ